MPTYGFKCPQGHETTEYMPISKLRDEVECAMCREPARRQIGSGAPPIFKGPGFYCNDKKAKP